MSDETLFAVTFRHLAPDLARAGPEFSDFERTGVTLDQLHGLIERLTALAPIVQYPAEPELRIVGPQGRFVVQARNGEIHVSSWSTRTGGAKLSPKQIIAMIMGLEEAGGDYPMGQVGHATAVGLSRRWKLLILVLAVAGSNGVTAWYLTRPPPPPPRELFPEHRLLAPEQAGRVLAEFAGDFETGAGEGDRGLTISPDGSVRWIVWGAGRSITEETNLRARAAESGGRLVLVTDNFGMIEMKDHVTIVYFRDTYRRQKKPESKPPR